MSHDPSFPGWHATTILMVRKGGRTVIGGDGLSLSIAAASVVAKVTRDRLMRRLALRYAGYGWERNVGYGTREHRAALVALGPTPHHRRSFAPCQLSMEFDADISR